MQQQCIADELLHIQAGDDVAGFTLAQLLIEHAASPAPRLLARVSFNNDELSALAYIVEQERRAIAKGTRGGKRYAVGIVEHVQNRVPDGFSADSLGAMGEVIARAVLHDHVNDWSELVADKADKRPDFTLSGTSFDIKSASYSRVNVAVRADRVGSHYDALVLVKLVRPSVADIYVVRNEPSGEKASWEWRPPACPARGDTPFYLVKLPKAMQTEYKAAAL